MFLICLLIYLVIIGTMVWLSWCYHSNERKALREVASLKLRLNISEENTKRLESVIKIQEGTIKRRTEESEAYKKKWDDLESYLRNYGLSNGATLRS